VKKVQARQAVSAALADLEAALGPVRFGSRRAAAGARRHDAKK
jgi:hypothetical protein